jgi:hypothetical protein
MALHVYFCRSRNNSDKKKRNIALNDRFENDVNARGIYRTRVLPETEKRAKSLGNGRGKKLAASRIQVRRFTA